MEWYWWAVYIVLSVIKLELINLFIKENIAMEKKQINGKLTI